jgi:hypothetical protein
VSAFAGAALAMRCAQSRNTTNERCEEDGVRQAEAEGRGNDLQFGLGRSKRFETGQKIVFVLFSCGK